MSLLQELLEKMHMVYYNNELIPNQTTDPFVNSIGQSKGSIENRRVDGCCGNGGCTCNASCRVEDEINEVKTFTPKSISQKPKLTV